MSTIAGCHKTPLNHAVGVYTPQSAVVLFPWVLNAIVHRRNYWTGLCLCYVANDMNTSNTLEISEQCRAGSSTSHAAVKHEFNCWWQGFCQMGNPVSFLDNYSNAYLNPKALSADHSLICDFFLHVWLTHINSGDIQFKWLAYESLIL